MFSLLAAALEDGWAFVKRGEEVLLVRPPYRQWSISVVPESTVEKAVHAHGFTLMKEKFADWSSLVAYLQKQLVETRKAQGQAVPESESVQRLVHYAPRHILVSYLDRIQLDLLPNREWNAALDLLTTLIDLEAIKKDPNLFDRTVDLLKRCREAMVEAKARKQQLIDENKELERLFPNVVQRYKASTIIKYMHTVSERRPLMGVGAV